MAKSLLGAVDTNVLLDQALGDEDVFGALEIIRERLPGARFVVTTTVLEELAHQADFGGNAEKRAMAGRADEEENDASVTAEAALIGCDMLLTSDAHLLDAQGHPEFREILKSCDVAGENIVIAKPRTIVNRFFRNG